MTVLENLQLWQKQRLIWDRLFPGSLARKQAVEGEKIFPSLAHSWDKQVDELSGGQKQSLAILSRTVNRSSILLLDEVTAGIDVISKLQILDYVTDLVRQRSSAALMITHDLEQVARYGSRAIFFAEGALAFDLARDDAKLDWTAEAFRAKFLQLERQGISTTAREVKQPCKTV